MERELRHDFLFSCTIYLDTPFCIFYPQPAVFFVEEKIKGETYVRLLWCLSEDVSIIYCLILMNRQRRRILTVKRMPHPKEMFSLWKISILKHGRMDWERFASENSTDKLMYSFLSLIYSVIAKKKKMFNLEILKIWIRFLMHTMEKW